MANPELTTDTNMYAMTTMYNDGYKEMASVTIPNKKYYCEKHSYPLLVKTDNFSEGRHAYFDKKRFLLEVLDNNPDIKWFWWLDCDAVITNHSIKFENFCDDNYSFVITEDFNCLNNGSFFIKNTDDSRKVLKYILEKENKYVDIPPYDNGALIEVLQENPEFESLFKICRQRDFNSYFNFGCEKTRLDGMGYTSHWEPNDFVIHFAGPMDIKIPMINFMRWFIKE